MKEGRHISYEQLLQRDEAAEIWKSLKMTMPKGNSNLTFLQAPKVIQKVKLNFFHQALY